MAGGAWVFDVEANGLLARADGGLRVLCAVAEDIATGETVSFVPDHAHGGEGHLTLSELPEWLNGCQTVIGHNIARYDLPLLERLNPGWKFASNMVDTLAWSRLLYAHNMRVRSFKFRNSAGPKASELDKEAKLPGGLVNSHSLGAWGYRLGLGKGDYLAKKDQEEIANLEFSQELLDYCALDVSLNARLYRWLAEQSAEVGWPRPSLESVSIEGRFNYWLGQQEVNGVGFDESASLEFEIELRAKMDEAKRNLRVMFPPFWEADGPTRTPAANRKSAEYQKVDTGQRRATKSGKVRKVWEQVPGVSPGSPGYVNVQAGCDYDRIRQVEFNPGSGKHIQRALESMGWKPKSFGADGVATCDEETLSGLTFEPVPLILSYMTLAKRLGMLSDGQMAWRKLMVDGRLHGTVHSVGARTHRCSHSRPNTAQVPKVGSPYGEECRALFKPTRRGWLMVGADASGLQLRALAHRMSPYDGGEFGRLVVSGDPHTSWQRATGLFYRNNQKTFTYSMLFGAEDSNLGTTVLADWRQAYEGGRTTDAAPSNKWAKSYGERARAKLLTHFPALDKLLDACARCYARGNVDTGKTDWKGRKIRKGFGYLVALDGRVIAVKTEKGALNDLLQSDEAVLMKWALVLLCERLTREGWTHGEDFALMLNVHDEWQAEAPEERAEDLGALMVWAIQEAGTVLGYTVPLDGEFKLGQTWADTH